MQDEIAKIENRLEKLKRPINGSDSDDEAPGSDEGGNDGALPLLPPTPSPCRGRYPPCPPQPDPDQYYTHRPWRYTGRPQTPPSPIGSHDSLLLRRFYKMVNPHQVKRSYSMNLDWQKDKLN